ncbi:sugar kinase [Clostridium sp. JS66]|uniref:sugar kinase n=1 Tax=Clostridium sp. JS66 TaxID=3064705 RepID=UPI00298D7798|nr:sugar kinase [Clostridium sp. JS66]WPC40403.1 sugar kinase [Clostridium sp. JS66]
MRIIIKDVVTFGEIMGMFIANEEGDLIKVNKFSRNIAGAEANVATGLARLGFKVGMMSKVGNDVFGKYIIQCLKKENIDVSNIKMIESNSTGILLKSKTLQEDPDVQYYRKFSAASTISIEDYDEDYFLNSKHMHVTGISAALSKSTLEFASYVMDSMRKLGKSISFDPNLRLSLWKSKKEMIEVINKIAFKADVVLPGISEGRLLTGYEKVCDIADYYIDKGVKLVVIKTGKEGAYYKTNKDDGFVAGFKVEKVVDTVGAGDGFAVGIISALLEKLTIKEALRRGNAIGSLAVMSSGDRDGLPTREQLNEYLNRK